MTPQNSCARPPARPDACSAVVRRGDELRSALGRWRLWAGPSAYNVVGLSAVVTSGVSVACSHDELVDTAVPRALHAEGWNRCESTVVRSAHLECATTSTDTSRRAVGARRRPPVVVARRRPRGDLLGAFVVRRRRAAGGVHRPRAATCRSRWSRTLGGRCAQPLIHSDSSPPREAHEEQRCRPVRHASTQRKLPTSLLPTGRRRCTRSARPRAASVPGRSEARHRDGLQQNRRPDAPEDAHTSSEASSAGASDPRRSYRERMTTPTGNTRRIALLLIVAMACTLTGVVVGAISDGWDPLRVGIGTLAVLVVIGVVIESIRQRHTGRRRKS